MSKFPRSLEKILLRYIKQNYGKVSKGPASFTASDFRHFAQGAKKLSLAFTGQSAPLAKNYFNDPVLRSGYLLYYLPVNYLKVMRVLSEFNPEELVSGRVRILDLGAGPGTSMFGIMSFYATLIRDGHIKDAWLDFTLIDQNFNALRDAKALHDLYRDQLAADAPGFQSVCSVKNYDMKRGGLKRFLRGYRYHLIILSNVINELGSETQQRLLLAQLLREQVEPNKGKVIVIDPASQKTSRRLQALRDFVIHEGLGHVHAPCLHAGDCPLNQANLRDWCHFYFDWERPNFIERVDKLVGIKKQRLQCSYLVLGPTPRSFKKILSAAEHTWRVISNPLNSKGKKELVLCGPPGRYHVMRLDRDQSATNKGFDGAIRGHLVEWQPKSAAQEFCVDGEGQLGKGDPFKILL